MRIYITILGARMNIFIVVTFVQWRMMIAARTVESIRISPSFHVKNADLNLASNAAQNQMVFARIVKTARFYYYPRKAKTYGSPRVRSNMRQHKIISFYSFPNVEDTFFKRNAQGKWATQQCYLVTTCTAIHQTVRTRSRRFVANWVEAFDHGVSL